MTPPPPRFDAIAALRAVAPDLHALRRSRAALHNSMARNTDRVGPPEPPDHTACRQVWHLHATPGASWLHLPDGAALIPLRGAADAVAGYALLRAGGSVADCGIAAGGRPGLIALGRADAPACLVDLDPVRALRLASRPDARNALILCPLPEADAGLFRQVAARIADRPTLIVDDATRRPAVRALQDALPHAVVRAAGEAPVPAGPEEAGAARLPRPRPRATG